MIGPWLALGSLALILGACGDAEFGGSSGTGKAAENEQPGPTAVPPGEASPPPTPAKAGEPTPASVPEPEAGNGGTQAEGTTPVAAPCAPRPADALAPLTYTLDAATGLLTVTGTAGADDLSFAGTGVEGEVAMAMGSGVTIIFPCAKELHVVGQGGADALGITGIKGLKKVTVDGDDGNDTIRLTGQGEATGGALVINGGAGDDTIEVSGGGGFSGVMANGD